MRLTMLLQADAVLATVYFLSAHLITDEAPSTRALETLRQLHLLLERLLASQCSQCSQCSSSQACQALCCCIPLLFDDLHSYLFRGRLLSLSRVDIVEASASQPHLPLLQLVDTLLLITIDICRLCVVIEPVATTLTSLITSSFTEALILRKFIALTQPASPFASLLPLPLYEEHGLLLSNDVVVSFITLFYRHTLYVVAHTHHL